MGSRSTACEQEAMVQLRSTRASVQFVTCFGRLIVGGVLIVVDVIKWKRGPEDIPHSKGHSVVCYQFRGDLVV